MASHRSPSVFQMDVSILGMYKMVPRDKKDMLEYLFMFIFIIFLILFLYIL